MQNKTASPNSKTKGLRLKVAVIGAGPCGLTACKALKEFAIDFDCLEASDRVGGVWNVERGGSGHRSLHTNTSTRSMAFTDFPFEKTSPVHPSANQMVDYFTKYAIKFSVVEHIKFNSPVKDVRPNVDGTWIVELESGAVTQYSKVIVATGKYAKAKIPKHPAPSDFDGHFFHSQDYLDAQTPIDLRAKRVVVVGLGSSAAEIASDIANKTSSVGHAAKVILSARSGRWVIPKIINGQPADASAPRPADPLPKLARVLPSSVAVWLLRRGLGKIFRSQFVAQQKLLGNKLPTPMIPPWADRPTLSSDFIPLIKSGEIQMSPGIERFEGKRVIFTDGSSSKADVIIYATGYTTDIPFISKETLGDNDQDLTLYQQIAHTEHDGLFFVGYSQILCSMWPLAEQQSRWIAKLLTGEFALPNKRKRKSKAVHLMSSLPLICGFYVDKLRREAGR